MDRRSQSITFNTTRYEIRKLGFQETDAALAIVAYCTAIGTPLTAPARLAKGGPYADLVYTLRTAFSKIVSHCIDSGHSYGVFDKRYTPRSPDGESRVRWDGRPEASMRTLLGSIDSPLVAVALSHGANHPLIRRHFERLSTVMPDMVTVYNTLDYLEEFRTPPVITDKAEGDRLLSHIGIYTLPNHGGRGLTVALGRHLLNEIAPCRHGLLAIRITSSVPAVKKFWENPPERFKAVVSCQVDSEDEGIEDGQGGMVPNPLHGLPERVVCRRIYVVLRELGYDGTGDAEHDEEDHRREGGVKNFEEIGKYEREATGNET